MYQNHIVFVPSKLLFAIYSSTYFFQKKYYNPRINVYNTIFSMNNIVDIYFEGKRQPLVADVVN